MSERLPYVSESWDFLLRDVVVRGTRITDDNGAATYATYLDGVAVATGSASYDSANGLWSVTLVTPATAGVFRVDWNVTSGADIGRFTQSVQTRPFP